MSPNVPSSPQLLLIGLLSAASVRNRLSWFLPVHWPVRWPARWEDRLALGWNSAADSAWPRFPVPRQNSAPSSAANNWSQRAHPFDLAFPSLHVAFSVASAKDTPKKSVTVFDRNLCAPTLSQTRASSLLLPPHSASRFRIVLPAPSTRQ